MLPFYENWNADFYAFRWDTPHSILPHIHHQVELMYVKDGAMDAEVDFRPYSLRSGDLVVALPHTIHSYAIPTAPCPDNRIWGMIVDTAVSPDLAASMAQSVARTPYISADRLPAEAHKALEQIFSRRYRESPLLCKAYYQVLMAYVWPMLTTEPAKTDNTLYRIIEYVLNHYREPLRAAEVAAELGISTSYLARIFSRQIHMNFNEYVNRLRIQEAESLLSTTDRPITDVMLEVGFESQTTFNRVFRQEHGISPRQYRNQTKSAK